MTCRILEGDCRDRLAELDAHSIDAVVTDPPYGLGFMAKRWDTEVPTVEVWRECLRVAKPGAHLLAFGGTRTFYRLACAIEDAGWEIRDCVMWVYGSGFPKSMNVAKAIDAQGHLGKEARNWEGWGTALKPAWEPIILARAPLDGTVASNVLAHGVGALNIDESRIASSDKIASVTGKGTLGGTSDGWDRPWKRDPEALAARQMRADSAIQKANELGRWPANLIHDGSDEVLELFPTLNRHSAARFFYCAKASRRDREDGCEERNTHPTVKPTDLMRYLCRLVTPPGGTVLDPFCGSGSTGRGAMLGGFGFVGIELEAEYAENARRRIAAVREHG
jgi:hypothetical protein